MIKFCSTLLIRQRTIYRFAQPLRLFSNSRFESSIFVDPEDNTIDIGNDKPSYKGSLVIVPTPIGNLGDLSLRQYEALTQCDIIACEDTRKTGKMLELLVEKRMKQRFKNNFGTTFDNFMDDAQKEANNDLPKTDQPEKESEEVGEEEALFFGAGTGTDERVLDSLI